MKKTILLLISAAMMLSACTVETDSSGGTLRISAASSLAEVMTALEAEWQAEYPDTELMISYGSSSKLRSQIEQGAPADLFLSASEADAIKLTEAGLLEEETVVPFAANRLVLASRNDSGYSGTLEELFAATDEKIAIGEPESVPLGRYTKKILEELGLWAGLDGQLVYAKDARQVLTYTESGNAALGIVYSSDAFRSDKVDILVELPEGTESIVYPAGILTESANIEAAERFLDFLTGDEGQGILRESGFLPVSGEAS
ncbi:molybdate ABC transporter substrate-binding protein [Planococcus lenghuensis]|uniref:Molybdate ABC transporter substrate-binding protein n=1 Tax=Planococcus lenghuensis TaxID=2213202 RepID=A0A1Q2KUP2_9BACL|nr:molybdate ABC transporter substrate-binding protein [Planococcus lenghuensis]AQQ51930.1 molybdate ABC transporter substrate-binding protein [Planococcus lenghuensis]